jgi:phage shock protein PspC (stress-responsive transcriptional regulator)
MILNEAEKYKEEKKTNNKLYRDSSNRIIAGVCSGVAEYFKIDPIIVRVLFFHSSSIEFNSLYYFLDRNPIKRF